MASPFRKPNTFETIAEDSSPITFKSRYADDSAAAAAAPAPRRVDRRTSVSAEAQSTLADDSSRKITFRQDSLNPEQEQFLRAAVSKNFLFAKLDEDSLSTLFRALTEKTFAKGVRIITEGELAEDSAAHDGVPAKKNDYFYIVETGSVEYFKRSDEQPADALGSKILESGPGSSFGELALMYDSPRAATVIAASDVKTWALDRFSFRKILYNKTQERRGLFGEFLATVPILTILSDEQRMRLSDALDSRNFAAGTTVIAQGESGEEFYLIESGAVQIVKDGQKVGTAGKGAYFGELALLYDTPRQATVVALEPLRVAVLGKAGFERLLGKTVIEKLKKNDPRAHEHGH